MEILVEETEADKAIDALIQYERDKVESKIKEYQARPLSIELKNKFNEEMIVKFHERTNYLYELKSRLHQVKFPPKIILTKEEYAKIKTLPGL